MDSSTPSDFSRQSAASISTLVDQPLSESPNKAERDKSDKMESATPVAHDHVHDHEHQHEHQSDHHEKTRRLSLGRRPVPRLFTPRSHRSQLSASAAAHHLHDGQYDEDFDIAPVDMPRELAEELSREPFQVLARHLSGVSIGSGDAIGIDSAPPDGGLEAWLVILGAWLVLFVQFGILTSFGQFGSYYGTHQLVGYSKSSLSWIGSIQTFVCFFGSVFSGRFFDSHGAKVLIISGTTIATGAVFAIAFCKVYYQFLLAHLLFGIGGGFLYSPCTAVVAHWFLKRRATAVGIILCGSGLGGVIVPIMLSRLFPQLGFKKTVLILAGMSGFLFLPSWFFVKARLKPKAIIPWREAYKPWKEARYSIFVGGVALIWMNYFTPYFFANDFALANGLDDHLATYSVAILQAGSFFGRGISGPIAERVGVIKTFVTTGVLSGIVILALWTSPAVGVAGTIVGLFLYGLFSGFVIALIAACCAQISPVREFGLRLGMMWTVASLPLLAGPQISGVLIAQEGDKYTRASIFAGITIIAGSLMTFAPHITRRILGLCGRGSEEMDGSDAEKASASASASASSTQ